ncbi:MAG: UDP-glucose/GDP-mannose dehydrogenase family protein [Myxococcales bacterium]|nr:UDP-glucose/GDP-mannose dehydrogenase family protein [Myxococcales bacterium]
MRIAVVGTGYVGLVAGACFADIGHTVVGIDTDPQKIAKLERNEIPIYEPGLEEVVRRSVAERRLSFTTNLADGARDVDIAIIAVGTPQGGDGAADMRYVLQVAEQLASVLERETVIVLKSTVPVGTNDRVQGLINSKSKIKHRVVNNPEFLKEGDALNDFMKPDRVVVGVRDDMGRAAMTALYAPLNLAEGQLMFMDPRSAEMTKYVANSMLAARISFMNEVARLCEATEADFTAVRLGVGSDARIGSQFLLAGPGFGGSCFPKDIKALMHLAKEHGTELKVLNAVDAANDDQKKLLFAKLHRALEGVEGKKIAVWGLAFKAKTDDVRESPALALVEQLVAAGATVTAHDPEAIETSKQYLGATASKVRFVHDKYEATDGADALVVVTEWNDYKNPDFDRLHAQLHRKVLIDGRNLWQAHAPHKRGFRYEGIGLLVR